MIRTNTLVFVVLMVTLTFNCLSPVGGGGGSQTVNTFTACVEDAVITGTGIPGHSVQCYDTGYKCYSGQPFKSTIVNDSGCYTLEVDSPGRYNLFSLSVDTSVLLPSAVIRDIRIAPDTVYNYSKQYTNPGTIRFMPPIDSTWATRCAGYEYVILLPGTPFHRKFNTHTQFPVLIKNIPESIYLVNSMVVFGPVYLSPYIGIQSSGKTSQPVADINTGRETVMQLILIEPAFNP